MTELMKQALIKETERHIAQDILYDDVYVGVPFTPWTGIVITYGIRLVKNLMVLMIPAGMFSL